MLAQVMEMLANMISQVFSIFDMVFSAFDVWDLLLGALIIWTIYRLLLVPILGCALKGGSSDTVKKSRGGGEDE